MPDTGSLPSWLVNAAALSWRLFIIILLALKGWLIVSTLWTVHGLTIEQVFDTVGPMEAA